MIDVGRLKPLLLNTGLQNKDNPLYQFLSFLIDTIIQQQSTVSTTSTSITQLIFQYYQTIDLSGGGGDGGDGDYLLLTQPGPKGDTGSQGPMGAMGAIIFPPDAEDGDIFPPIVGPQGNPGPTGSQGAIGPSLLPTEEIGDETIFQLFSSGSGAYSFIEEKTASASASLDLKNTITATYDVYIIKLINILPVNDNVTASMRVSTDGGATFDSGANYRYAYRFMNSSGTGGNVGSETATSFEVCGNLDNSTTSAGLNGWYILFNPLSASLYKNFMGYISFLHNDTHWYRTDHSYWYASATAVNAFQLFMSSGNISSGKIRTYGVKNS